MTEARFMTATGPLARLLVLLSLLMATATALAAEGETMPEMSDATFGEAEARFAERVEALADTSFREKREIVDALAAEAHPRARALLTAFGDKRLFYREADGRVFIALEEGDDSLRLQDAITHEDIGEVADDGFDDVRTNTALRKQIRGALARLDLNAPDPATRMAAVAELSGELDDANVAALRKRRALEEDPDVLERVEVAVALADLASEDPARRMEALQIVSGEQSRVAYNRIKLLLRDDLDGNPVEPDPRIREAAASYVARIDSLRAFYDGLETIFFGLSLGSVLVLAAIGLAITFGVMGVINMAHGELIMLGAYTTFVVQQIFPDGHEWSLLVALPAAFLVSALVGIVIERGVIRFLYGRPLETLLATFGVSLILQQAVRVIFSPLNRSVVTPEWMSGALQINPIFSLTYNRLYIIVFALIVFFALQLVLKKTRLGLQVRAVSQNRGTARAMGIRSERVNALTFGLGSGIAGIAGVALAQLTNVGPNLGQSYIIDSFMVVVFGGVGNLWGTLTAAFSLGIANKIIEPMAGAVLAEIMVLVFIILFIQRKPRGLFPQRGRAAEE